MNPSPSAWKFAEFHWMPKSSNIWWTFIRRFANWESLLSLSRNAIVRKSPILVVVLPVLASICKKLDLHFPLALVALHLLIVFLLAATSLITVLVPRVFRKEFSHLDSKRIPNPLAFLINELRENYRGNTTLRANHILIKFPEDVPGIDVSPVDLWPKLSTRDRRLQLEQLWHITQALAIVGTPKARVMGAIVIPEESLPIALEQLRWASNDRHPYWRSTIAVLCVLAILCGIFVVISGVKDVLEASAITYHLT